MTKIAYERLKPFLHRKSARQRVILYLIAEGYTVGELVAMSAAQLRALKLPVELQVARDEMLDGIKGGKAFVYPGGKALPHTAFYRLIRVAAETAVGQPMSQETFRQYINASGR